MKLQKGGREWMVISGDAIETLERRWLSVQIREIRHVRTVHGWLGGHIFWLRLWLMWHDGSCMRHGLNRILVGSRCMLQYFTVVSPNVLPGALIAARRPGGKACREIYSVHWHLVIGPTSFTFPQQLDPHRQRARPAGRPV